MSQKNFWTDRSAKAMHPPVVAEKARWLDCPYAEAQPPVGVSVDTAVRIGQSAVVSGPVASSPCPGSTGQSVLRASGDSGPSQAQEPKQCVGVLRRRSDLSGARRSGRPPLAQPPDDPSHPGSTPAADAKTSGSVSERTRSAWTFGPTAERRSSDGLYRGTLSGIAAADCRYQPQGQRHGSGGRTRGTGSQHPSRFGLSLDGLATARASEIFADGQRHESDGRPEASPDPRAVGPVLSGLPGHSSLYPRAAARLQRDRRAVQWAVAAEGLAAVSLPIAPRAADTVAGVPRRLQRLPEKPADPPGKSGAVWYPSAPSAPTDSAATPVAALSRPDLVYPENR